MPQEISDEELLNLGKLVVRITDDKRLEGDHPAFRLLITLLVNNLRTKRTQLSARYLHGLTSIAIGHVGKVIERLEKMGYISVRRIGRADSPVARKLVNVQESNIPNVEFEEIDGEEEEATETSFAFLTIADGQVYRVRMTLEEITQSNTEWALDEEINTINIIPFLKKLLKH